MLCNYVTLDFYPTLPLPLQSPSPPPFTLTLTAFLPPLFPPSSSLPPSPPLPPQSLRRVAFSESDLTVEHYYPKYDYSDYEEIQDEVVTTGFSFSFWKSKEEVDAADSGGGGGGLSQRLHPSLRSPETDPDSYRYSSPSRDSTSATPGHTPLKPSGSSITTTTTTITLHNYKPSILSGYDNRHTLQDSFVEAMRNGEGGGGRGGGGGEGIEGEEGDDDNGGHIMPADGTSSSNFYASLSTDAAAMLW